MIFTQSSFIFLTQSSFNFFFYTVQFYLHSPVLFLHGQQSSFIFCVVTRPLSLYCNIQGGKTFCASFCASLIAGSRRAFLCVDCVCLFGVLSEMHEVRAFAPCKAFLFDMFAFFSSLENYFGFRTTNVKGKTDHSVSLRWNKEF